jgi:ubiquinone biosynthesis protein
VVEGVARQLDPEHSIWDAARPVIERWMIDSIGPEARLKDASAGIASLGRAMAALPDALQRAARIAAELQEGGIRLHPDSAKAIGEARPAGLQWGSPTPWIVLLALVIAAIAII